MDVGPTRQGPSFDVGVSGYEKAVEVGRGGFAVVYRAWQPGFDRHVAIKVVSSTLDTTALNRFERECLAIGALSEHPNIVTVHDQGRTADGRPYIVMEFMSSGSLGSELDRTGPLDWQRAVEVAIKVAGALESAHRAGVLHRDVKPENVLVSRYGEVKLGDFGIARIQGQSETATGTATASWAHAPPELVSGKRPTKLSDVYSLASMLYTLVAGTPPFMRAEDEGLLPLLARIPSEPVPDLRPRGVPDALCRVMERGMAKDPAERQQSAADFGRQLQRVQADAGVPVTSLPLEIIDAAVAPSVGLPSLDATDSGDFRPATPSGPGPGDGAAAGPATVAARGGPEVPPAAPTAAPPPRPPQARPPEPPPPTPVPPGAAPPPPGAPGPPPVAGVPAKAAPGKGRGRLIGVAAAVLVAVVVGVLLLGRGGSSPSSSSSDTSPTEEDTTVVEDPSTTLGAVRYSIIDALGADDQSEDVELTVGDAPTLHFAATPAATLQPVQLSAAQTGKQPYRLVVTTLTKAGQRSTFTGSGNLDVQQGRQFEVATVQGVDGAVCLSLNRVCQGD